MMMKEKKINKVEYFKKTSDTAVSVVREMLESLRSVNDEITTEKAANEEKIAQIKTDNESLDKLKTDNEKIISNFGALLS